MILDSIVENVNELLPEPHASLLLGMIFGVRATMPSDFYQALITTGTIHMIALSGMNVSIIIRLLFDSASSFLGKHGSVVLTLLGILFFLFIVGPSPTIVRASIMGALTILASYMGRKNVPLYFLMVAAASMILYDPNVVGNISFQLSFLATLGIILFGGSNSFSLKARTVKNMAEDATPSVKVARSNVFQYALLFLWKFVKADLRITLSAQLFTVPVILYNFQRVSLISPLANVAVAWLVPFITYAGLLVVFLSYVLMPLAYIVGLVVWVPLTVFINVVSWLSTVPIASIEF